jgi:predicted type IV restriction endonuclease
MASVPAIASKRIVAAVPKFVKVLGQARERDVNESDTVTIVTDILEEVFGFDKYTEITREYAIQGTYCDLAIKTAKRIEYLIEVKAIGIDLKENHMRQAVNYAAQEGIKWVILTNGVKWQIYRVTMEEKVKSTKLVEFDFTAINPRKQDDQEILFLLCKRGVQKDLIDEYYEYRQSVNRYTVGALVLTEPVISAIRKELRKIKDGLKVSNEEIESLMANEILKRDLIESDAAKEAQKNIQKLLKKRLRAKPKSPQPPSSEVIEQSDG